MIIFIFVPFIEINETKVFNVYALIYLRVFLMFPLIRKKVG